MLACAGVAILLLMLLISFHPDDPGWMSSGTGGGAQPHRPGRRVAG